MGDETTTTIRRGKLARRHGAYRKGRLVATDPELPMDPEENPRGPLYVDPGRFAAWARAGYLEEERPAAPAPPPPPDEAAEGAPEAPGGPPGEGEGQAGAEVEPEERPDAEEGQTSGTGGEG